MEKYGPCDTGIHVCGIDEVADEFTTEANFAGATRAQFERAREECQRSGDEPTDLVVDLMEGGDIVEDFSMTRQMLPRLRAIVEGA